MEAMATRLDRRDVPALWELLDRDPIDNAYLRSELRLGNLEQGLWWGVTGGGDVRAVALGGSLVVPYVPVADDARPLAEALSSIPPRMIVGPREQVAALHHGRGADAILREIRDPQPLLVLGPGELRTAPGAPVREARPRDLDQLTAAAAAMHREEMGIDPMRVDAGAWRVRMATLIARRWCWVWTEGAEIVFKCELSAWMPDVVQLQGVWTAPAWRYRGIASAAMASVCARLLEQVPLCSLYVNSYNQAALALYRRIGFRQAGAFATYLY